MMDRWWRILAVLALAGCVSAAMASDKPSKNKSAGDDSGTGFSFGKGGAAGPFGDEPMDVSGGELKYIAEEKAVAILGYATLVKGGYTIKARNMVYFRETKEIYAEGDVLLMDPSGSSMRCDSLYFNFSEENGEKRMMGESRGVTLMGTKDTPLSPRPSSMDNPVGTTGKPSSSLPSSSSFNTVIAKADVLRSNTYEHQEAIKGTVTTDDAPKEQIFKVTFSEANFRHNEKIETWNNVVWVGKVPVFYFPYLIRDLRYDWPWVRVSGGKDDKNGYFGLATIGYDLDPKKDWYFRPEEVFLDTDYRSERGWGSGLTLDYTLGKDNESHGSIGGYYTSDQSDRTDDSIYGVSYDGDARHKFEWEHYQKLTENWDMRIRSLIVSDRDFMDTYFEKQSREAKDPESFMDIRKIKDWYVLEFYAEKNMNDWQTESEYLPEARFTIPGLNIGDTGMYLRSDSRMGVVSRHFDEEAPSTLVEANRYKVESGDSYDNIFRAHNDTRLYYPIKMGEVATLTPYVGGAATYYQETYDDDANSTRGAGLWGADLANKFYGVFDGDMMGGSPWRHVIEPSTGIEAVQSPTVSTKQLYNIDELEDPEYYGERHELYWKLHNKFQTYRKGRQVDVFDFDVKLRYLPRDDEAQTLNPNKKNPDEAENWRNVQFDFVVRPTDYLTFYGDAEYDPNQGYLALGNLGADWRLNNRFRLFVQDHYQRGDIVQDPTLDYSNLFEQGIRIKVSDKYTLELAAGYQFEDTTADRDVVHGLSKERITVIRNLKVFELSMSFIHDEDDDDNAFYFSLTPIGYDPISRSSSESDKIATQLRDSRYHPEMVSDQDDYVAPAAATSRYNSGLPGTDKAAEDNAD